MSSHEDEKVAGEFGFTDCHSHAYGPYGPFPPAKSRIFDPPESLLESLEEVWRAHGIDWAVLIQGSAYGTDHAALLNAIAGDPEHRRGVAILQAGVSDAELIKLHQSGIRGVRFNWVKHLLGQTAWERPDVLGAAAALLNRVGPLGGMFGELLATSVNARGVVGLIIDAGCRDVAELTAMRFPVWSRAISAKGTIKATLGNVNTPVVCAGVLVHAGDVIIADDDGVVVVPHGVVAQTIADSEERLKKEEKKRAHLAAGELGMDIENMRPKLEQLGLTYYDHLDQVPD